MNYSAANFLGDESRSSHPNHRISASIPTNPKASPDTINTCTHTERRKKKGRHRERTEFRARETEKEHQQRRKRQEKGGKPQSTQTPIITNRSQQSDIVAKQSIQHHPNGSGAYTNP
jgi:hypothetical protein